MAALVAGGGTRTGVAAPSAAPRQALVLTGLNDDEKSVALDYDTFLAELTMNSKLVINNLTKIAEENVDMARPIATVIMSRLATAIGDAKLPLFYLLDSITKNVGKHYIPAFRSQLAKLFLDAYPLCSLPVQGSLQRMLGTWAPFFGEDFVAPLRAKLLDLANTIGKPLVAARPTTTGSSSLRIPPQVNSVLQARPPQPFQSGPQHQLQQQPSYPLESQQRLVEESPVVRLERETENLRIHIDTQYSKGFTPTPEQLAALNKLVELLIQLSPDPNRKNALMQHHRAMLCSWQNQHIQHAPNPPPAPMSHAGNANNDFRFRTNIAPNRGGHKGRGRPADSTRAQVKAPLCSSLDDIGKAPHMGAINMLYDDLPHVNISDGMRFRTNEEKAQHLDWRFAQNKRNRSRRNGGMSRCWYSEWGEWLNPEVARGADDAATGEVSVDTKPENDEPQGGAIAGDDEKCPVCGEGFELSWCDEKGAWVGKDAWRDSEEGPVVHVQCLKLTSPHGVTPKKAGIKRKTPDPASGDSAVVGVFN